MASAAPIFTLNLGTQSAILAEFARAAKGGLVLRRYCRQEILADPAADASRLPQMRLAVSGLKDAFKLKNGTPISYSVSGQSLFTRFVKVPRVSADQIAEMVGFEAQQNVPFPLNEVVWDYQLVGDRGSDTANIAVVLVAIKTDALDELNEIVESAGLRPARVDAAPMALYNAFRFNSGGAAGCSLLVDIGARNTNLIFSEGGRIFVRSVPFGGSKVTEAIAKEFSENFAAAEARKKKCAYIALGGAYAEDKDPEVAKVSKLVRNAVTRLHSEIVRNINSYRAQQGGSAPNRIFLAGAGANLAYSREFFGEKFAVPIDFFNPLQNVAVATAADVEAASREAHLLGEVVGLALRHVHHCPMELNLPPAAVLASQREALRRPALALAATCFLLALGGWWLLLHRSVEVKAAALGQLEVRVRSMQGLETALKKSRTETTALQQRAAPLLAVADDREFWPRALAELNARLPENFIWITLLEPLAGGRAVGADGSLGAASAPVAPSPSFTPRPPGKAAALADPMIDALRVRGLYLVNPAHDRVIVDFVQNLAKSPLFDLDLANQAGIIVKKSPENEKEWAFDYELNLKLRQPLPLP